MPSDQGASETRLERDLRRAREGYERWRRREIEDRKAHLTMIVVLVIICIGGFSFAIDQPQWWIAFPVIAASLIVVFVGADASEAQRPPDWSELSNLAPLDQGPPDTDSEKQ